MHVTPISYAPSPAGSTDKVDALMVAPATFYASANTSLVPSLPDAVHLEPQRPRRDRTVLQRAWRCIATPPGTAKVVPRAQSSRSRTSWRPVVQLGYGTVARTGLYMSARMLAYRIAVPLTPRNLALPPIVPRALGVRQVVTQHRGMPQNVPTTIVCGVFFAISLGLSLFSSYQFANDTAKICRPRARVSLAFALLGCVMTTLGTALNEFFRDKAMQPGHLTTIAPTVLGMALLMVRLPHSFVASELVHGNTPGKYRSQAGTMLFPAGTLLLSAGFFLRADASLPVWSGDLLFSAGISCVALAGALPRTDLSRVRVETA